MAPGFQAINRLPNPSHDSTATDSSSGDHMLTASGKNSQGQKQGKKKPRKTCSAPKACPPPRPSSPLCSSPNASLPSLSDMLGPSSRTKLNSESKKAATVPQSTSPGGNKQRSAAVGDIPQKGQHGGHSETASAIEAPGRQAGMTLGMPTSDPGDRMELCRKVKILPTVERIPVRPKRKRTATSGPSPHTKSTVDVSNRLEPCEEPGNKTQYFQTPVGSRGSVPGLAAEPAVKAEPQDPQDGGTSIITKSSDLPSALLGLDQKHPQVKAYRSSLREQLRILNLHGLAESNQATHATDVIKGLKERLRKFEELGRQIKALQGQGLLSRDGKLFTLGKQLGLVHDDRPITQVKDPDASHQASSNMETAATSSPKKVPSGKPDVRTCAVSASSKHNPNANTVTRPELMKTHSSQIPPNLSLANSVPVRYRSKQVTAQTQQGADHQAQSCRHQANTETTEAVTQKPSTPEFMFPPTHSSAVQEGIKGTTSPKVSSTSPRRKDRKEEYRRRQLELEQELNRKVEKHGRILGDGLRHSDNLMLGYGHRQTVQIKVPALSGPGSSDGNSETVSSGDVHKPLSSRERHSLERHARLRDQYRQRQHKREVRLARCGNQDEAVEGASGMTQSSDPRAMEGRQSEIPSWEFYNLPPTNKLPSTGRAMPTPPLSSPRVVIMRSATGLVEIIDMETPSPSPARTVAGNNNSGKPRKRRSSGAALTSPSPKRQKQSSRPPRRQSHSPSMETSSSRPAATDLVCQPSGSGKQSQSSLQTSSPDLSTSSAESEAETHRRRKVKGKTRRQSHSPTDSLTPDLDLEATVDKDSGDKTAPLAQRRPLQDVSSNFPRAQTLPPSNTSAPFLARHSFVSTGDVEKLVAEAECKIKANMLRELKSLTSATNQPAAMSSSTSMPPPPRPVTGPASASTNVPRLLPPSLLSLPLEKHLEDEVVRLIKDPSIKGPTRVMRAGWAFTCKGDLRSNLLHCPSIQSRLNEDELAKVTPRKQLRRLVPGRVLGPVLDPAPS